MQQFLIKTKDDYLKFLLNLPETLEVEPTKIEELFEFDYVNEDGVTYFEYIDSLLDDDIVDFNGKAVKLNSISVVPKKYPCVLVISTKVTPLNTLDVESAFIYQSDFV